MRRNLFSMKDDQRRAMFASMRGGSRFAETPDIPKVTVSYEDTTIGGGESEPVVETPKVEETKVEEPIVESTVEGVPSSVSSAFDLFDKDVSTGDVSSESSDTGGTVNYGESTSYTVGENIDNNPVPPEKLLNEEVAPVSVDYNYGGTGLEYVPSSGNVPIAETLLDTIPYENIEYNQTAGRGKQQDMLEVVLPEQKEVNVVGGAEEVQSQIREESRLDKYNNTLKNLDSFMNKVESDLSNIDPLDDSKENQERMTALLKTLDSQRRQRVVLLDLIDKEKYPETWQGQMKKGFDEQLKASAKKASEDVVKGIVHAPVGIARTAGGAVAGAGRLAEREFNLGVAVGGGALTKGAEAFGATAGTGVTESLRGVRDIIEGPQQEFHIPPGYQKIWTGSEYVVRPQARNPIEPWAVSKALGVGMPPGVAPSFQGQSAIPVRDTARLWGPASVVSPERGYGGVDYLWGVRDIEPQGFKPMFDVPKSAMPDYNRIGKGNQYMWVIPPAEIIYGATAKKQQNVPYRGVVQRTSYVSPATSPSIMQRMQGGVVPSNEVLVEGKVKTTAPTRMPMLPRLPSATAKAQPLKVPRSVANVISGSEKLNDIASTSGIGSPEYVKQEAKVQSNLDYATRHNSPGSVGRTALEGYGLVSPSGI
jgi:hypothetical protein